jgi:MFS family permease
MSVVAMTLGSALCAIPLARVAVRRGRRPALTGGWAVAALGGATCVTGASQSSTTAVLLGLALLGSASATGLQSRFAAVDRAAGHQVARTLSLVVWSTTLGAVLGPNLTGPGAAIARAFGVPELAGPILISTACFALAAIVTGVALRPEPLERAAVGDTRPLSLRGAAGQLRGPAAVAVAAIAVAHAVMAGVMSLTPVHMSDDGMALRIIGLTISIHIAGMFALAPVFGWLSDALGAVRTILLGQATLLVAVAIAGTSGHSEVQITIGLALLGIGWSASTIAGSALLTRSVDPALRAPVQGLSDSLMQAAGALGGILAGIVVALGDYATLNLITAVMLVAAMLLVAPRAGIGELSPHLRL